MKSLLSSILFLSFLVFNTQSFAQDKTVKGLQSEVTKDIKKHDVDSGKVWKTGGQFDLNLAQGSQSNWAAGGDDFSFSVNSYFG